MKSTANTPAQPVAIVPNGVYTSAQAAVALQCSVTSIRRACAEGRLPAGRGCGSWRVLGAHLIEWATGPGGSGHDPAPELPELSEDDIANLLADEGETDE